MDRILLDNNGTLEDFSYQLDDYHSTSETINIVAAEDKIYLGSAFPFNSKYFKVDSANVSSSNLTIRYWDGNQFRSVVEITDETASSGVPFAQSGHITWVPNKDFAWTREDSEDISEISSVVIYDQFWLEISFSADITFDSAWAGSLLCNSDDIGNEFPDLMRTNVLTAFKAGKTDWEEQIVRASSLIIEDLISRRVINSGSQILDRRKLRTACVSKTAQLIYTALGDDYEDQRILAQSDYKDRISKKDLFNVDLNNDARLSIAEQNIRQGRLTR